MLLCILVPRHMPISALGMPILTYHSQMLSASQHHTNGFGKLTLQAHFGALVAVSQGLLDGEPR